MPDITITVPISTIYREVSRRSSLATETDPFYAKMSAEEKQSSQLQGEGDRVTGDFLKEAAKNVLNTYESRQGDVEGLGFEYDLSSSGNIVYRFAENDIPLSDNQTASITYKLQSNTKDALIFNVLRLLYGTDGNMNKEQAMLIKTSELIKDISGDLYRLHD